MNEIVEELLTRLDEAQREDFEERAAIMQYDGGLTRDHAECLALLCILRKDPAALLPSYMKHKSHGGINYDASAKASSAVN
jgi:hypothetical protein